MRELLRFYLGDELVEIGSCDPTGTLLDWLRLDRRLTGSKEGCAEGDCGACTVVVGRLDRGKLRFEPVDSCIRLLPTLDGCQVLTIEHLRRTDGALHPVQQALLAHHGSQCGFCTPGIAMALFSLWLNREPLSVQRIEDGLAGNLCRCTGYQPILNAALSLGGGDGAARADWDRQIEAIRLRLEALADDETVAVGRDGRRFEAPASTGALARLAADAPDATLVAGATDVGLWITKGFRRPERVISLGRVEALREIVDEGETIRFGAMANHLDVRRALAPLSSQLDEVMRRFGGEQVRAMGTIGGNIANGSPIGDLPPVLIALGATLVLARSDESAADELARRTLPLEAFFLDYRKQDRRPGEFVEAVIVRKPRDGELLHVSKVTKRFDEDISAVCGAFLLRLGADGRIAEARLAYGGMAGTPKRAAAAEATLTGKAWDEDAVEAAIATLARDFTPLDDMRASARYRLTVAGNLLRRFLIETTEPAVPTRVAGLLAEAAHG